MLTTELLVTYGFEKDTTTPLEKWSFENLFLFVERISGHTYFRVYDSNNLPFNFCIHTEANFQQILKTVDEGGSITKFALELSSRNGIISLNADRLQDTLSSRLN